MYTIYVQSEQKTLAKRRMRVEENGKKKRLEERNKHMTMRDDASRLLFFSFALHTLICEDDSKGLEKCIYLVLQASA